MATYGELMAQAKALMDEAEKIRKAELSSVIADIRAKMTEYGLTISDLGGGPRAGKAAKSKSTAVPKYRGPNGELWAGGPGRKPEWIRAVLDAGKSIEDFRI